MAYKIFNKSEINRGLEPFPIPFSKLADAFNGNWDKLTDVEILRTYNSASEQANQALRDIEDVMNKRDIQWRTK